MSGFFKWSLMHLSCMGSFCSSGDCYAGIVSVIPAMHGLNTSAMPVLIYTEKEAVGKICSHSADMQSIDAEWLESVWVC